MAQFPNLPLPSHISAPAFFDPLYQWQSDAGYTFRRPKWPRPLRRYAVEWLGKTVADMRRVRDFLLQQRLGAVPFDWMHTTALDGALVANTTPVMLTFEHGLLTGHTIWINNATTTPALNGLWLVTRLNPQQLTLNGSVAGGAGECTVQVYLPIAVARFDQDTWESPVKLRGPEAVPSYTLGSGTGAFSWSLVIEESF